jgi:molecular chaperone HscB
MQDHFDRLGLPRRFLVDPADLERAYLAHSRAVHPDYHVAGTTGDLAASLEASAAVNEAYNTLKDPFARAEYLLRLENGPTAGEHKALPAGFLEEMLEAREQVELVRGNAAETAKLEAGFVARYDRLMRDVAGAFAANPDRAALLKIRERLNAAKYVRRLVDDLHAD